MPATMLHLLFALRIDDKAPTEFYIGNIAPDAIQVRDGYHFKDKSKLHFRDSENRVDDIKNLAKSLDMSDPYCKGYITHLFLDLHYDKEIIADMFYKKEYDSFVDFFEFYKIERDKSSSYIFSNELKVKEVWSIIAKYGGQLDYNIQGITHKEIVKYVSILDIEYKQEPLEQSKEIPHSFLKNYLEEKYNLWLEQEELFYCK